METRPKKEPKDYKVLLIGNDNETGKFKDSIEKRGKHFSTENYLYTKLNDKTFYIYCFKHKKKDLMDMMKAAAKDTYLFIYINAKDELIDNFERMRNKNNTIAINYDPKTFGLSPNECLTRLKQFKKFEIREKTSHENSKLMLLAHKYDKKSAFFHNHLPTDVVKQIAQMAVKEGDYYQNNIFIKCPPSVKENKEVIEEEITQSKSIKGKIGSKLFGSKSSKSKGSDSSGSSPKPKKP